MMLYKIVDTFMYSDCKYMQGIHLGTLYLEKKIWSNFESPTKYEKYKNLFNLYLLSIF